MNKNTIKALKAVVMLFAGTLLVESTMAQGVFAGTKAHPVPVAYGHVHKITEEGPPLKLEATKLQVKLSNVHYEAVADSGGLFKPTSGEAQTVTIGDFKVELASKDFRKGFLDTKDFGKVALYVIPNLMGPDRWILAVTDQQLKKIAGGPEGQSGASSGAPTPAKAAGAEDPIVNGNKSYDQRDYAKSFGWFYQAATNGNVIGQLNVGVMYRNGKGVKQDFREAFAWLTKAADAGNAEAQYKIGLMLRNGEGVEQNINEADTWIRKAADGGFPDAVEFLEKKPK